jgi:hypothetical protein
MHDLESIITDIVIQVVAGCGWVRADARLQAEFRRRCGRLIGGPAGDAWAMQQTMHGRCQLQKADVVLPCACTPYFRLHMPIAPTAANRTN